MEILSEKKVERLKIQHQIRLKKAKEIIHKVIY